MGRINLPVNALGLGGVPALVDLLIHLKDIERVIPIAFTLLPLEALAILEDHALHLIGIGHVVEGEVTAHAGSLDRHIAVAKIRAITLGLLAFTFWITPSVASRRSSYRPNGSRCTSITLDGSKI